MLKGSAGEIERRSEPAGQGWQAAGARSALVIAVCWAGFLFVPERLLALLTTRVGPRMRDALVTLWVLAFFVVLSWGFVALQRGRRR